MKLFTLFSACSGYRLYQNLNLETGEMDYEMESKQDEFNRVFKKENRLYVFASIHNLIFNLNLYIQCTASKCHPQNVTIS